MAEDCFLCSVNHDVCKYTKGRNIGEKAIKTLQKVANSQNNELLANALSEKTSVWVADVCYKRYSDPRRTNKPAANVESFSSSSNLPNQEFKKRQRSAPFCYKSHCLICEEKLNFDLAKKTLVYQSIRSVK